MINLLPPEIKQGIHFAKRNRQLRHRILLLLIIFIALGGLFGVSRWYATKQIAELRSVLTEKKAESDSFKDIETKAQHMQTDIALVKKLLQEKTEFSSLLSDLAAVLPTQSYVSNIGLSTDASKPVQIVVVTDSFETAGIVRNALLTSPRISGADIQNITANEQTGDFTVNLVVAFKKVDRSAP